MDTKVVTDLDTLRAVAHPLRMRLLGALRTDGPATASELGRRLGETSGSTSYHLRQLERFGFVGDDDEPGSRRERRWRALHRSTHLPPELWASPGGREAHAQFAAQQTEHLRRGLAARAELDPADAEGPVYGHSDYVVRLDPADASAMLAELHAVVERYANRSGSVPLAVHVLSLPVTA